MKVNVQRPIKIAKTQFEHQHAPHVRTMKTTVRWVTLAQIETAIARSRERKEIEKCSLRAHRGTPPERCCRLQF